MLEKEGDSAIEKASVYDFLKVLMKNSDGKNL
jgi:hypothetical protein